mmetsp:Transcript_107062/g.255616  ORF Transcript_107062/g.255616 Transcript_107062/m.255616 type:complete len:214 (-) Transcript_107062:489-1130(-)
MVLHASFRAARTTATATATATAASAFAMLATTEQLATSSRNPSRSHRQSSRSNRARRPLSGCLHLGRRCAALLHPVVRRTAISVAGVSWTEPARASPTILDWLVSTTALAPAMAKAHALEASAFASSDGAVWTAPWRCAATAMATAQCQVPASAIPAGWESSAKSRSNALIRIARGTAHASLELAGAKLAGLVLPVISMCLRLSHLDRPLWPE